MAQAPGFAWAKMTGSISNSAGVSNIGGIATDTVNHFVYVTGSFTNGEIDFGTGSQYGETGAENIYIAKYTLNGAIVWAKTFDAGHDCHATGVKVDGSGNFFVTGYSQVDTLHLGSQYLYNSHPNSTDHTVGFLAKFDPGGNCLWAKGNTGGGGVEINSIALDNSGNAYVTGFCLDGGTMLEGHSMIGGAFFAKFNTSGTLQWFAQGGPDEPLVSQGNSIAVDHSGNCVVVGGYADDIYFGSFALAATNGNGTTDRFVVKLDGATGNFLWAIAEGIWESPDMNFTVATDAADNIYYTGYTGIAVEGSGSSASAMVNFVEKLDASGAQQWFNGFSSPLYTQTMSITADAAGNTYMLMSLTDTTTFGAYTITPNLPFGPGTSSELVVVKTNSAGVVTYAKSNTIPSGSFTIQQGFGIALDGADNVYFAGTLDGATDCDGTHLDAGNGVQMLIAKLGTTVAGIDEHSAENPVYTVFPNPASDLFYISHIDGKTTMQILDINGKVVKAAQLNNTTEAVDVSTLSNGIYFIELTTKVSHVTQKLVIAK